MSDQPEHPQKKLNEAVASQSDFSKEPLHKKDPPPRPEPTNPQKPSMDMMKTKGQSIDESKEK